MIYKTILLYLTKCTNEQLREIVNRILIVLSEREGENTIKDFRA